MDHPDAIPRLSPAALPWLDRNWPFVGLVAAAFLGAVGPLVASAYRLPVVLVYGLLGAYLVHQAEEHVGDRFRRYVNDMFGGFDVLTPRAAMVTNVVGVWIGYLVVLLLTAFVDAGFGLVAVYTTLVNGVLHGVGALGTRRYNPGLVTAVVLFLPLGVWAWRVVGAASGLGALGHGIGVGVALLIHVALVVYVRQRQARLVARQVVRTGR